MEAEAMRQWRMRQWGRAETQTGRKHRQFSGLHCYINLYGLNSFSALNCTWLWLYYINCIVKKTPALGRALGYIAERSNTSSRSSSRSLSLQIGSNSLTEFSVIQLVQLHQQPMKDEEMRQWRMRQWGNGAWGNGGWRNEAMEGGEWRMRQWRMGQRGNGRKKSPPPQTQA